LLASWGQSAHRLAAAGTLLQEVIQTAHQRLAGRPHGKLLPRYAGPIAEFVLSHPDASRGDTLNFIERTWDVRVSTVALYKFLKKYGLDRATRAAATAAASTAGGRGRTAVVRTVSLGLPRTFGGRPTRPTGSRTGAPLFVAHTQYAGAFLLLPQALDWLRTAETCFSDDFGSLRRGLLTSVFGLVTGLERIFHLQELDDVGSPC